MIEDWYWIPAVGLGGMLLVLAKSWYAASPLGRFISRRLEIADSGMSDAEPVQEVKDDLPLNAIVAGLASAAFAWALLGDWRWRFAALALVAGCASLMKALYDWSRLTPELGQDHDERKGKLRGIISAGGLAAANFAIALLGLTWL